MPLYNQNYGFPTYMPFGAPDTQSGTNDLQGVRWVAGMEEVKAASVPFGRSIFMERNNDIFYVKDTNGNIRSFKYKEIPQPTPENFVTRQEFDDLRNKYEQLIQSNTATTQPTTQQPVIQQPTPQQPITVQPAGSDENVQWDTGTGEATVLSNGSGFGNEQATI